MGHTVTLQSVGERLRAARIAKDYRPEQVAVELEVSKETLFRYERGEQPISYVNLVRAARLLDRPVEWFAMNGRPR